MVSRRGTTLPLVPPDRPDKQAADCDEENWQQPFVNQPLECEGELLCRHSFCRGSLGCIALHQIDSAVCGLAAWGIQDSTRQDHDC